MEIKDKDELRLVLAGVAMHAMLSHGTSITTNGGIANQAFDLADKMIRYAEEKK